MPTTTTPAPACALTVIAWRLGGLTPSALWWRFVELGGDRGSAELAAYLEGAADWPAPDHNSLAHTLNEALWELTCPSLAPYRDVPDGRQPLPVGPGRGRPGPPHPTPESRYGSSGDHGYRAGLHGRPSREPRGHLGPGERPIPSVRPSSPGSGTWARMDEWITWATCLACGRLAAAGWVPDEPVEFDCPNGCAVSADRLGGLPWATGERAGAGASERRRRLARWSDQLRRQSTWLGLRAAWVRESAAVTVAASQDRRAGPAA
ncbi:hypothetical protein [Geodermatophilus sp. SYSU D00815]